jgi:murein L,D-transpeptidase YcbB/YkuD
MRKNLLFSVSILAAIFLVSGCGTVPKKFKEEVSGIKTKVSTLESRVESVEAKQAEVERATSEQAQALEDMKTRKEHVVATNVSVRPKEGTQKDKIRSIQECLKNAGFYNGKIDGVRGRQTRNAIRQFQKANGLKADGVVGKKTWEFLSKYASGTEKTAGGPEEAATK